MNPLIDEIDRSVYHFFSRWQGAEWLCANNLVSLLGAGLLLVVLTSCVAIYLFSIGRVRLGLVYFLTVFAAMKLNAALKVYFARARPQAFNPDYSWSSFAFPSGHALGAMVFYLLTYLILRKLGSFGLGKPQRSRWAAVGVTLVILAVGFSRMALGVHWASDVVGGYWLGLAWVFLFTSLGRKYLFK